MPELSDADILEIIGFFSGWTASDDDAARACSSIRQVINFLPEAELCGIDRVVPFVTALTVVLTSVPQYDGELPLDCRLTPTYIHRNEVVQVAGDIMGLLGRGGVGSSGANIAVDMALVRDWLRVRPSERFADPCCGEVCATVVGRRNTFTIKHVARR